MSWTISLRLLHSLPASWTSLLHLVARPSPRLLAMRWTFMLGVDHACMLTGSLDHALQVSSTAQLGGEPLRRKLASMAQTRALFLLKMQPSETGKLRFFLWRILPGKFYVFGKGGCICPLFSCGLQRRACPVLRRRRRTRPSRGRWTRRP